MAKFVYKMQNILEIKYKLETQAKTAYAEANNRLREEELKLKSIYDDINKYENEIRDISKNVLDVTKLKWCSEAIEIKKLEAQEQNKAIEKARKQVELTRIKLNEIMVDRKTHEKLRERAFEDFKQEIADEEKKEVDELVSFKFNKAK
jgi:flagellar FliJ protein